MQSSSEITTDIDEQFSASVDNDLSSKVTSTTENLGQNQSNEKSGVKDPDSCTLDNEDSINLDIADEEKLLAEDEVIMTYCISIVHMCTLFILLLFLLFLIPQQYILNFIFSGRTNQS